MSSDNWEKLLTAFLDINHSEIELLRTVSKDVLSLHQSFVSCDLTDASKRIYGDNERLRKAYSYYYLFVNIPKLVYIFERYRRFLTTPEQVLDIGTGPGTAALGMLSVMRQAGRSKTSVNIDLVDKSREFAKLSRFLIDRFRRHLNVDGKTRYSVSDILRPEFPFKEFYDLIMMTNILSEFNTGDGFRECRRLINKVLRQDGHLLLMEPGSVSHSRRMLIFRDYLTANGWHVIAPCPSSQPCPALKNPRDWCHMRIPWSPSPHIIGIDERTGFKKSQLSFSYCLLARNERAATDHPGNNRFVVVSDLRKSKGRMSIFLCHLGEKKEAVLLNRQMTDQNAVFSRLERYNEILLNDVEIKGDKLIINKLSSIVPLKTNEEFA
ncbi:methyltransferase domain-containing protein [bacterium]|nr:methyltransferase domain-containing protein [candidate division CSSED10-310 bacterium]